MFANAHAPKAVPAFLLKLPFFNYFLFYDLPAPCGNVLNLIELGGSDGYRIIYSAPRTTRSIRRFSA